MLKQWKTLSTKTVYKNPWWSYNIDSYRIPGKVAGEYHYVHTEGSSMVVPVLGDGKLILVNQYRYLCGRESIEFPCGGVKPGKSYDETAMLELEEETGYLAGNLERVGEFNPYNGVTNEFCAVYVGRDLVRTAPKPDVTEEFEIMTCSVDEVDSMIRQGKLWDGMTLAAWTLVRERVRK